MEKLKIKDIARMSGVSTTVVSFVINDKPGVSEETRRRIKEIIKKTNYKPSINSRRLVYQKSFNIAAVIRKDSTPFSNLFYFEIAEGILQKSKEFGYNIVFTDTDETPGRSMLPKVVEHGDADGVIFFDDTEYSVMREMMSRNIPFVVVDAHSTNTDYACVRADYELAACTATQHLIENGHRDIGIICKSGSRDTDFYSQVFSGFKRALEANNLSSPSSWIQLKAESEEEIAKCVDEILSMDKIPTGILCGTDMIAINAMHHVAKKGYKVPDDLSFVGIDDILLSSYVTPHLTTIRIDKSQMGEFAMKLVMDIINGRRPENITVTSHNLIIRDSVKKIK